MFESFILMIVSVILFVGSSASPNSCFLVDSVSGYIVENNR